MAVLLSVLALGMIATGIAAIVFGAPIVQVERGWAMVISGSVVASGGAVLLGVALASQRLGRIARETLRVRDRLAALGELMAEQPLGRDRMALEGIAAEPAERAPRPPPPLPPAAARSPAELSVVGQYASGGNTYTMYSDGSVHAETPSGQRRFSSLDELRSFVAAGGEAGGPSPR